LSKSNLHEIFVNHLVDRYECPPTQTAETCKGKGYCHDCWCEWAEESATKEEAE